MMRQYDFAINCASVIVAVNMQRILAMFDGDSRLDPADLLEIADWAYGQGYITDSQKLTQKGRALLSIGVDSLSS